MTKVNIYGFTSQAKQRAARDSYLNKTGGSGVDSIAQINKELGKQQEDALNGKTKRDSYSAFGYQNSIKMFKSFRLHPITLHARYGRIKVVRIAQRCLTNCLINSLINCLS